jgi:hypothetical protein
MLAVLHSVLIKIQLYTVNKLSAELILMVIIFYEYNYHHCHNL